MPTDITVSVKENGSAFVNIIPKDENAVAITPLSAAWWLVNGEGEEINSRSNVTISSLSASMDVELDPADLLYSEGPTRVFRVRYTYTSGLSTVATGNDWVTFHLAEQNT